MSAYQVYFVMRKNGSTAFTSQPPSVHDAPLVMKRDQWKKFRDMVDRGFDEYEGLPNNDPHEVAP